MFVPRFARVSAQVTADEATVEVEESSRKCVEAAVSVSHVSDVKW